jgi:hypothetical protein
VQDGLLLLSFNASAILVIKPNDVGYTMILDSFGPESHIVQVPYKLYKQDGISKKFASRPLRYANTNLALTHNPFL